MSSPNYSAWGVSSRLLSIADHLAPSLHSQLVVGFDGIRIDSSCYSSDRDGAALADCDLLLLVADHVPDAAIISFCVVILSMYVSALYNDGFGYLPTQSTRGS
jgi:hypothetical protein